MARRLSACEPSALAEREGTRLGDFHQLDGRGDQLAAAVLGEGATVAKKRTAVRIKRAAIKSEPKGVKRRSIDDDLTVDQLAAKIVRLGAIARATYKKVDKLVEQMIAGGAKHGATFVVGSKRYKLTDNFRRGENKVFRTTAVVRWSLDKDGDA